MNPTITEHFLRQLNELANILFVLMVMSSKLQKSFIDTESEIPSPNSSARQLKKICSIYMRVYIDAIVFEAKIYFHSSVSDVHSVCESMETRFIINFSST